MKISAGEEILGELVNELRGELARVCKGMHVKHSKRHGEKVIVTLTISSVLSVLAILLARFYKFYAIEQEAKKLMLKRIEKTLEKMFEDELKELENEKRSS